MNPAIVISAYNRPHALARLFAMLDTAEYPDSNVPLVISIDRGHLGDRGDDQRNQDVRDVADRFDWRHGPKRVIHHDHHRGLVQQFLFCGGLTREYGAVVFLEDDLGVSPVFYRYSSRALTYYERDERIAGISLYGLWFNGYTKQPFVPLADGADVFFLQVPYTQGQAWTARQWQRFADWHAAGNIRPTANDNLHAMWLRFDQEDYFPIMTKYLVATSRYYVFPRVSLTTGMGDAGTHFEQSTPFFQVPLLQSKDDFAFKEFAASVAVYDSFFEILPDRLNRLTHTLQELDYAVDLYATKSPRNLRAPHVLTSRRCRAPQLSFGKVMLPHEANVAHAVPGSDIALCKTTDVRWDWLADIETKKRNHDYFTRKQRLGKRAALEFALLGLIHRR
ncbi:MAG: hypothetical protein KGJ80_09735 [Chloroflexota bacterium]|nr:hypothetical protein [Chloroflexota bacterium]